eukprot:3937933-Rhodomonas_salina.1
MRREVAEMRGEVAEISAPRALLLRGGMRPLRSDTGLIVGLACAARACGRQIRRIRVSVGVSNAGHTRVGVRYAGHTRVDVPFGCQIRKTHACGRQIR